VFALLRINIPWTKLLQCATVIIAVCLFAGVASAQDGATKFDQQSLKKLARYLLRPLVRVSPPSLTVKDRTLYYYPGNVLLSDTIPTSANTSVPSSQSDPLVLPLGDQLRIELLRQFIALPENSDFTFLGEPLNRAEAVVARSLADIDSHTGTRDALLTKLEARRLEVNEIIDKAVRDYAEQKQLNLYKSDRKALAASADVAFSSTPPGGIIYYLLEFQWKVATTAGKTPEWRLVAQTSPVTLNVGTYRIRVVWPAPGQPGGQKASEYTVEISNNGNFVLVPSP